MEQDALRRAVLTILQDEELSVEGKAHALLPLVDAAARELMQESMREVEGAVDSEGAK